jgi:YVTN family beta-propeller protein
MKKKKRLIICSAILLLLIMLGTCDTGTTPGSEEPSDLPSNLGKVYISNTGDATVSVIDLKTLAVTGTIDLAAEVPGTPKQSHFFELTQDGQYLWIGERQGTAEGKIIVVDLSHLEHGMVNVIERFDVGSACGQHLSYDGKWIFVVSEKKGTVDGTNYDDTINIFDTKKISHIGTIPHGSVPHVLETTRDSKFLWTTSYNGGTLVAYDITSLTATVPAAPVKVFNIYTLLKDSIPDYFDGVNSIILHALAIYPDGKHVIVGRGAFDRYLESGGGGDMVINVETGAMAARIPGRPHNYDISPDGKYLLSGELLVPNEEEREYLSGLGFKNLKGPLVRVIPLDALSSADPDYTALKVENIIDAGAWGYGGISHQVYDPTGTYIIITTTNTAKNGEGTVVIVDSKTLAKKAAIPVGKGPHAIAVPGYAR